MSYNTNINPSDSENMCVVCFKNVNIYSIGVCDHPVCFECSTRMRVLCRTNECPICRGDMPKVIFCRRVEPFKKLKIQLLKISNQLLEDRKFGICFESPSIQRIYYQLLDHNCNKCERLAPFRNFNQLKEHMRKEHELHYCDLCVTNLRIFTWERRCYTRSELAQHRRKGDIDDTSHRGHPLCQFCDTRYMDSDELFRHLRRDHLFCHFCDADGLHQYYNCYESLRQHFQSEHYLCEEGDCLHEKFTSVFRSDIDLKAHRASVHGKHLSKAATKQARTLELEFTLAPRPRPEQQQSRGRKTQSAHYNQNDRIQDEGAVGYDTNYVEQPEIQSVQLTAQDFPSLSGATPTVPLRGPGSVTIKHVSRGQKGLTRNDENFPALSGDASIVRLSVNSSVVGTPDRPHPLQNTPNVSIHVNHRHNGAITTHISSQNSGSVKIRPHSSKDFPALSSAPVPEAQWLKTTAPKEPKIKVSKVAPAPVLPHRDSPVDFPSLGKNDPKSKKSSVTMPVSNIWVNDQSGSKDVLSKTKNKKKKSKNITNNNSSGNDSTESKSNTRSIDEVATKSVSKTSNNLKDVNKNESKQTQQNGVLKKRSELKIDSLQINDTNLINGNDNFPTLGTSKLPPGINSHPPPGFAANDLTFTNSSGQSFSILPTHQFIPPPNFTQRNCILIEKFMSALKSNDEILEFKQLSNLFRNGNFASDEYYEHCKQVIGNDFSQIFPELLVLLPDIEKQQELFKHHVKQGGSKRFLEVCASCNQVVISNDLRNHLSNHTLENHFPALGTQEISSVWRK